jgi:serine protease Do
MSFTPNPTWRRALELAAALAVTALAGKAAPAELPLGSRPSTVKEILERAEKWTVAIQVEREKDLPLSSNALDILAGSPRRLSKEARAYYKRPSGYVSGVLVDDQGDVVTSLYNVAGELKSLKVTLPGGETYPAKVVAKSSADDIALLRIERPEPGAPLPFSEPLWADSSKLRPGQITLATGRSPDPSHLTVTQGILSAVRRNGGRAIQTDAELNYGNSGGAILDLDGRIIAIAGFVGHTQLQWGFNSGVGFGTSGSVILEMLPYLKKGENVEAFHPPLLGVQCERESLEKWVTVDKVYAGSAAERAGIHPKDVLLELNGTPLLNFDHLRRLIFASKVNDSVKLKVRRGEDVLELEASLGMMVSP